MKRDKSIFQFKQFEVKHNATALKVTTDAVVFGSWVNFSGADTILDIGTGTGILALMAAQQNEKAIIMAVEVDEQAAEEATYNFTQSKWSSRLSLIHYDFNAFSSDGKFDLIISNPPYFQNALLSGNSKLAIAKHSIFLTHNDLLRNAAPLLHENGRAFFVLPFVASAQFCHIAEKYGLYCNQIAEVASVKEKSPYLVFLMFEKNRATLLKEHLYLFEQNGTISAEYQKLAADFYL